MKVKYNSFTGILIELKVEHAYEFRKTNRYYYSISIYEEEINAIISFKNIDIKNLEFLCVESNSDT